MSNLKVNLENMDIGKGPSITNILFSVSVPGLDEDLYFICDDIELDIDDFNYVIPEDEDSEENYSDNLDCQLEGLKKAVVIYDLHPVDEDDNDISDQPEIRKILQEYGKRIKDMAEGLIAYEFEKNRYIKEDIEDWILDSSSDDTYPDEDDIYLGEDD